MMINISLSYKCYPQVLREGIATSKNIVDIIERNYKSGFLEKQLPSKNIRGIPPATVYRHYDKLRHKGMPLHKKGSSAKTVITSVLKDAINKLVKRVIL